MCFFEILNIANLIKYFFLFSWSHKDHSEQIVENDSLDVRVCYFFQKIIHFQFLMFYCCNKIILVHASCVDKILTPCKCSNDNLPKAKFGGYVCIFCQKSSNSMMERKTGVSFDTKCPIYKSVNSTTKELHYKIGW